MSLKEYYTGALQNALINLQAARTMAKEMALIEELPLKKMVNKLDRLLTERSR